VNLDTRLEIILPRMLRNIHISRVNTSMRSSTFVFIFFKRYEVTYFGKSINHDAELVTTFAQVKVTNKIDAFDFHGELASSRGCRRPDDVCHPALFSRIWGMIGLIR
jgi:hypothetical protein